MISATYVPVSFENENAKHERAIDALCAYYRGKATINRLPGKNTNGYDLEIQFSNELDPVCVEIKTLEGGNADRAYPTFCIETFTDYEKTKPTDWRTARNLDNLIVINRRTQKAYVYDIDMLRAYVNENLNRQRPSGTGTGQFGKATKNCSWVILINWVSPEAGFIKELDLSKHYPLIDR